jgi:hypothetical protein
MKRVAYAIIFILFFLCSNQGLAEINLEICSCKSSNVEKDVILRCLVGHLRMYPADIEGAKQAVLCAIEEWKQRDGAIGFMISDTFLAMLEENPKVFFDVMANNESIFSEWTNKLGSLSFTWHKEPPSPLEAKRQKFITFLSKLGPLAHREDILRQKLLTTLRNIKVRQVE